MQTTIGDRLKEVRTKYLNLSQEEFGNTLGIGRGAIYNIEKGLVEPKESFMQLLCSTYNINREWLETGEGDMFLPMTEDEELAKMFGELFTPDTDPRIKKAVKATIEMLKRLPEDAIPIIGDYAEQIASALKEGQEK
ncbi:MAG: helix-turn-helix transcriptional regulator [Thermoguttaceae bacterium]|nr:helix-turn-helix transcriptional regulator [Thermoguttaceae bacterium]